MNTMVSWMLAGLLALPLQVAAQVNSLPSQPHLLVKGEAQREVEPDRFTITVNLEQIDAAPELARTRVQADAAAVLDLFKAQRALANSTDASSLSIAPSQRYVDGRQVFEGTRVRRTLSATFAKLDQVRAVLRGLKTSEQLQVSGIHPEYSAESQVRGELKAQAAAQTRTSARQLADAYGVQLGGLYTISEVAPDFAYGVHAGSWYLHPPRARAVPPPPPNPMAEVDSPRSADQAESLEAGSITLTEHVYAIFLIAH